MVGKLLLSTSRSTDGSGSPEMLAARKKKKSLRIHRLETTRHSHLRIIV